ncbi:MAG: saccharopine dehydrogenase NADP-binding domain-containing protein [Synergistaceae bacterium]|nr:saccharopine dehydrogenase NADP-binding domain-containing protein [Synergistaceae bacterium]
MKRILVLGAGLVARPCVQYLLARDMDVTVVDLSEASLKRVTEGHRRSHAVVADGASEAPALIDRVRPDVVVSLLPPQLMAPVARACLKAGVHLVHPAYLDRETEELSEEAKKAGLLFLVEMGLDPGIDHMSAARTIRAIHDGQGKVLSFRSVCGAIPAAEANTNPWGYKLSWAPASLIGASRRTARILLDGQEILWPDGRTYEESHMELIEGMGWYEVYANADSLPYIETYGIPEVQTLYRGTIRYPGWSETICAMNVLELFDETPLDLGGKTFCAFLVERAQAEAGESLKETLCRRLGLPPYAAVLERFRWLGLLDDRPIPFERGSARDIVSFLFAERLVYEKDERDLVILQDECLASFPGRPGTVRYCSTLVDFGIPGGDSSIARTTGLPPAIAARLIAEGKIEARGVHRPVLAEIYEPVLAELEQEGIVLKETEENRH